MPVYELPAITDISLASGVAKSCVGVTAPATRRVKIRGIRFGGNSTTQTDPPVLVEIVTGFTAAGTSTAQTPLPIDVAETAALAVGGTNFTVEPSGGAPVTRWADRISPIGGTLVYDIPPDQRPTMAISQTASVRCTSGSTLTNVRVGLIYEE